MTSSFSSTSLPHTPVLLLGNTSEAKTARKEDTEKEREKQELGILEDQAVQSAVHLPGICPFIWLGMCGAGGPLLTIPSEGMLWPCGGWGGGPLWFIPPGPIGMFWVGGYRNQRFVNWKKLKKKKKTQKKRKNVPLIYRKGKKKKHGNMYIQSINILFKN